MARVIDYVSLSIIVFMFTFVWTALAFSEWIVALIFSAAITFIVIVTVKYAAVRRNRPYSPDRLGLELSLKGSEYLINLVKSAIKNNNIESTSGYIVADTQLLIAAYKFNLLTVLDITQAIQLAVKLNLKDVYIMCRGIDRRAYQAINLSDIKIHAIKTRQIFRFLSKHNALPNLKPAKNKFSFSLLLQTVFQRSNTKNYIFTGVILMSVAFLTPLKTYYLTLGSISLFLALLTLTPLGKGSFRSIKIFETLERLTAEKSEINQSASFDNAADNGVSDANSDSKNVKYDASTNDAYNTNPLDTDSISTLPADEDSDDNKHEF